MATLAGRLVDRQLLDAEILLGDAHRPRGPRQIRSQERHLARRQRVGHASRTTRPPTSRPYTTRIVSNSPSALAAATRPRGSPPSAIPSTSWASAGTSSSAGL